MRTAILSLVLATVATAGGPPTLGNGYAPPLTFQATTTAGNCTLTWSDAKQQWAGSVVIAGTTERLNLSAYVCQTPEGDLRGKVLVFRYGAGNTDGVAPPTAAVDYTPFKCRLVIIPSGFDGFDRYRTKITGTITE